jgi:hypothetical protein
MLFLAGFSCSPVSLAALHGVRAERMRVAKTPWSFSTLLAGTQILVSIQ